MQIRRMAANDLERVADLCTQLGYPAVAADVAPRLDAIAARSDHAAFVADDDGAVLGWVHVCAGMLVLESDPWAEVGGLVVDERARGRGVGDRLLAAAEDWARERGYRQVRLRSNVIREAAHEFYRRRGYEVFKTQLNFRKPLTVPG